MKDLSDITLSLPTIGLRKCLLKIVEQDAYTYKMINLMDLKNLVMLINGIMEYKICYAITIMLDTWDILDICLDNVQEEHLLGVLISLIDINSETKYISIKSDTGYQSDEELFQMIYKHIFPEPRKQIRTKRKKQ
jgi:hypothetical protein